MSLSMHAASVPVFVRMFGNAQTWLDKAQAHAEARGFDSANYLGLRLAPDMLPLARQVQIASDGAKGCVSRLAGIDMPKWADDETTLADLRARLQKTVDFVQTVPADQIDGSETRAIVLPRPKGDALHFDGQTYLQQFVLPNLYFHLTTTYTMLRQAGVEIGKRDFLGKM